MTVKDPDGNHFTGGNMWSSPWVRLLLVLAVLGSQLHAQQPVARWYAGNTHAHTANSDGDSSPDVVARWYREHGYNFLFITDHEFITDVGPLNALLGAAGEFIVISGQEVTQRIADAQRARGVREAHVNALGVHEVILPLGDNRLASEMTIADSYERNLALIRAAGGIPQVNHPNFRWSVPLSEMLGLPDSTLFEVWNGHPNVYNDGGVDSTGVEMPSTDALWDSLLTRGRLVFGVADDDSHSFRPEGADNYRQARPGRGWIMVRADTLTPEAILAGLRRGDFYSSTGVTLRDYRANESEILVEVVPAGDRRYMTEFIGAGGRILAKSYGTSARYQITGLEGYVRARVSDSSGRRAWMQPTRVQN